MSSARVGGSPTPRSQNSERVYPPPTYWAGYPSTSSGLTSDTTRPKGSGTSRRSSQRPACGVSPSSPPSPSGPALPAPKCSALAFSPASGGSQSANPYSRRNRSPSDGAQPPSREPVPEG